MEMIFSLEENHNNAPFPGVNLCMLVFVIRQRMHQRYKLNLQICPIYYADIYFIILVYVIQCTVLYYGYLINGDILYYSTVQYGMFFLTTGERMARAPICSALRQLLFVI